MNPHVTTKPRVSPQNLEKNHRTFSSIGKKVALSMLLAIIVACSTALTVSAFNPNSQYHDCAEVRFPFAPAVVLHPHTMLGNFSGAEIEAAQEAMEDIHFQFNSIGGTSALVGNFTTSALPLELRTVVGGLDPAWHDDIVPTIHVGFTTLSLNDFIKEETAGAAAWLNVDPVSCLIREVFIVFQLESNTDGGAWLFTEPDEQGVDYFEAEWETPKGIYFRTTYLHELIHAFGLSHVNDSFSILTRGVHSWLNRPSGEQMGLLPDDIAGIRYLYPAVGHRTEIGVLNTWYRPDNDTGNDSDTELVASQATLCGPSTGTTWNHAFSSSCGLDNSGFQGSTEICPGDPIFTRATVANFGTRTLDVRMRLFFSEDEVWNGFNGKDVAAAEREEFELEAASSIQKRKMFVAPEGLGYQRTYRPIVRVRGVEAFTGAVTTDWIPLAGTIKVKAVHVCNPVESTPRALP